MTRDLRHRLNGLENRLKLTSHSSRTPLPDSRRLLNLLEWLLSLAESTGLAQLRDSLGGAAELLRGYVAAGRVGAYVEYQCGCRLDVVAGSVHKETHSDRKIAVAVNALDGLEESLRQCLEIERWRTKVTNEGAS